MNQNSDENEHTKRRCVECHRAIEIGQEVIEVEQGVLGFRGTVPLRDRLTFCSRDCVRNYFNGHTNGEGGNDRPQALPGKRRVP